MIHKILNLLERDCPMCDGGKLFETGGVFLPCDCCRDGRVDLFH
jgi:hypothetical protein